MESAAPPPAGDVVTPAATPPTATDCAFDRESFASSLALPGAASTTSGTAAVTSTVTASLALAAYSLPAFPAEPSFCCSASAVFESGAGAGAAAALFAAGDAFASIMIWSIPDGVTGDLLFPSAESDRPSCFARWEGFAMSRLD